MFFLGGFNTIIPHLIYLSLIWVFVLIGLSGRMKSISPKNSFQSNIESFQYSYGDHLREMDITAVHTSDGDLNTYKSLLETPAICIMLLPEKVPLRFSIQESIYYRGPPAI